MAKLTDISWEDFENLPLEAKRSYLENGTKLEFTKTSDIPFLQQE